MLQIECDEPTPCVANSWERARLTHNSQIMHFIAHALPLSNSPRIAPNYLHMYNTSICKWLTWLLPMTAEAELPSEDLADRVLLSNDKSN